MTEFSTLVALSKPSTTVTKTTETASSGNNVLPIGDTSNILVGMKVSGTNLSANSIVLAITTDTNITMINNSRYFWSDGGRRKFGNDYFNFRW